MRQNRSARILIFSLTVIFLLSGTLTLYGGMPDNSVAKGNAGAITALKSSIKDISNNFKEDELLVKFKAGVSAKDKSLIHARHGAKKIKEFARLGIHHVKLNKGISVEEAIDSYQKDPDVEYAEPNYQVTLHSIPGDPLFNQLWGLYNTGQTGGTPGADISATEAWDITTGDNNVVVAVIDTGIDYNHEDLLANVWLNTGEISGNKIDDDGNGYVDDMHGINVITGTGDPLDDHGHGTHVSGTIGAAANNGFGVAGINWNIKIIACKFLDSTGGGYTDGAVECLEYVWALKQRGVNIIATSNSWGGAGYSRALYDAINAQQNILFIAAAGNSHADNDQGGFYPANYFLPNVIAVAATDHNDNIASFSNYGRRSVSVGAPGVNILSSLPGGYGIYSGTSMATPHVTGIAALIKSQDMTRDWKAIRNLVFAGGDNVSAMNGITITGKRINAFGSLTCIDSPVFSALGYVSPFTAGIPITLSALSINCSSPVGPVTVTTSSGEFIELHDDNVAPDLAAGDGIFSATWTPLVDTSYLIFSSPAGTERVLPALRIITNSLPTGAINTFYSQTLAATGGMPPYVWSVISGGLPAGLTLNSSSGEISGTPTAGGSYSFTLQVADSEFRRVSKGFIITISGARPDLVMTSVVSPGTANVGQQITVISSVKNQGSSGAGAFRVGIYLSADQAIGPSDTLVGYGSVTSLGAGAEQTLNTIVTIPASFTTGTYFIGAVADYTNSVVEADESNNSLAGNQLTVTNLPPDLTLASVSGPSSGGTGQSITAAVTMKNQGAGNASGFYVNLYLSTDAVITTADTFIGNVFINNGLAAGAQQTVNITGKIPVSLATGTYYVGAIVDSGNAVKESDETNNSLAGNQIIVQVP